MSGSASFPLPIPDNLYRCLREAGHIVYCPNPGNLGDELIAASTVSLFERIGISYEVYREGQDYGDAYTLVYGGGGIMVPEWGNLPHLIRLFTAPEISRCIVLPHSLRDCDELLSIMDERFTVFCREKASYSYCRGINHRAQFELADDMAFYTAPMLLPKLEDMMAQQPCPRLLSRLAERVGIRPRGRSAQLCKFYRKTVRHMQKDLSKCAVKLKDGRRAAFFLRRDQEKNEPLRRLLPPLPTMDLSRYGGGDCRRHALNLLGVLQMHRAMQELDLIITDRLHVAISAAMCGRECIMLDNSYCKLSGVYEQSMRGMSGITLCHTPEETAQTLLPLLVLP